MSKTLRGALLAGAFLSAAAAFGAQSQTWVQKAEGGYWWGWHTNNPNVVYIHTNRGWILGSTYLAQLQKQQANARLLADAQANLNRLAAATAQQRATGTTASTAAPSHVPTADENNAAMVRGSQVHPLINKAYKDVKPAAIR